MSDVGQVWERPDGTIFLTLDEPAKHAALLNKPTVHCLVVVCPPNHFPEGYTLLITWPFPALWSRVI